MRLSDGSARGVGAAVDQHEGVRQHREGSRLGDCRDQEHFPHTCLPW